MTTVNFTPVTSSNKIVELHRDGMTEADDTTPYLIPGQFGIAMSVQVTGTWGGSTAAVEVSNDGTYWTAAKDLGQVDDATLTDDGIIELNIASKYFRIHVYSGASTSVDVIVIFRK